ncbi:MAG: DUF4304 domain-containing protein [Actinobacteria bacterium]|nr:MAG: DUF4304 domain-containing protein [Actinomycetota bacterium]
MTAQEAFTMMVKDEIAPALRELGFKGSGQRFTLPSETHWALLGLQKFTWSDRDRVDFTANVTVVGRDVWEAQRAERPHLPARPSANTYYGTYAWQTRIGALAGRGEDAIWRVSPDRPTDRVAAEFVTAVRDHVLPAMRTRITVAEPRL